MHKDCERLSALTDKCTSCNEVLSASATALIVFLQGTGRERSSRECVHSQAALDHNVRHDRVRFKCAVHFVSHERSLITAAKCVKHDEARQPDMSLTFATP